MSHHSLCVSEVKTIGIHRDKGLEDVPESDILFENNVFMPSNIGYQKFTRCLSYLIGIGGVR